MRSTLGTAALAVAALAAPASAQIGVGVVAGGASVTVSSPPSATHWSMGACRYAGSTLSLDAIAWSSYWNAYRNPTTQDVSATCTLHLKNGTSYTTSGAGNGTSPETAFAAAADVAVPAGAAVQRICLTVTATWWGYVNDAKTLSACQRPGVTAWTEDAVLDMPLEPA